MDGRPLGICAAFGQVRRPFVRHSVLLVRDGGSLELH
jgi:hypothetical protein